MIHGLLTRTAREPLHHSTPVDRHTKQKSYHDSGGGSRSVRDREQEEGVEADLGWQINDCTHHLHTRLNRLIIERLPLALPPFASSPILYTFGLEAFAAVYFAFEREWTRMGSSLEESHFHQTEGKSDRRVRWWRSELACMRPAGLEKTDRLVKDLNHLRKVSRHVTRGREGTTGRMFAPGPVESAYIKHIEQVVLAKPHLLFAYAWVMYMAVFSGGRWVRAQLRAAGRDFWEPPSSIKLERTRDDAPAGYHFLCFQGSSDGEDIKKDFRGRLLAMGELLTPVERAEVLCEAQLIFQNTIALVLELEDRALKLCDPVNKPENATCSFLDPLAEISSVTNTVKFGQSLNFGARTLRTQDVRFLLWPLIIMLTTISLLHFAFISGKETVHRIVIDDLNLAT